MTNSHTGEETARRFNPDRADCPHCGGEYDCDIGATVHANGCVLVCVHDQYRPATPVDETYREAVMFFAAVPIGDYPGKTYAEKLETAKCYLSALSPPPAAASEPRVTNGAYEVDDFGPIGDAARAIASYCEGDARQNVYRRAKQELAALSPVEPAPAKDGER